MGDFTVFEVAKEPALNGLIALIKILEDNRYIRMMLGLNG